MNEEAKLRGRPRHPPSQKRRHQFTVKLNDVERDRLKACAREAGLPPAEMVRFGIEMAWLNNWGHPILIELSDRMHFELKTIGRQLGVSNPRILAMDAIEDYIAAKGKKD